MLKNCDKIMHLRFNFDACPIHSSFGFVHLTHENHSDRASFCHNSLSNVNTQLLIYKLQPNLTEKILCLIMFNLQSRNWEQTLKIFNVKCKTQNRSK